jgi:nitrogen regulatory protein P-II 1
MFKSQSYSAVTAIVPKATTQEVVQSTITEPGTSGFLWEARGTLLQDSWWKRYIPPISPAKTMMRLLVPNEAVSGIVNTIVEKGRLHQQATGAVFSTPCESVYFGSEFHVWPRKEDNESAIDLHNLSENLSVIYCIVGHEFSDRVAKSAVMAGAHGPIVYYSEGRGLRDRLGWLRITKEHEKEVLMVLADEVDVEEIFDAMAAAGELHLPGRGFMYRLSIHQGMFNLPSRVSHHHYDASMQQIINAIDHLNGHSHWRDQAVFEFSGGGRGVGIDLKHEVRSMENQASLYALVTREGHEQLMDMMLDGGATGLNIHFARVTAPDQECLVAGARINAEYGLLRCITDETTAQRIAKLIELEAERQGLSDFCMSVNPVPRVATYIPGMRDYRVPDESAIAP